MFQRISIGTVTSFGICQLKNTFQEPDHRDVNPCGGPRSSRAAFPVQVLGKSFLVISPSGKHHQFNTADVNVVHKKQWGRERWRRVNTG